MTFKVHSKMREALKIRKAPRKTLKMRNPLRNPVWSFLRTTINTMKTIPNGAYGRGWYVKTMPDRAYGRSWYGGQAVYCH